MTLLFVDVNPGLTTTITVKYNKVRRKAVINPLDYVAAGITTGRQFQVYEIQ